MLAGGLCGALGALGLMPLLAAGWLAERQKVAATLMAVVAAFAAADLLKDDAGLVAAIVMGIVLANQRRVDIARIVEFKETLGAILLGVLFVLLAAQVQVSEVVDLGVEGIVVVLIAVVLVRPLVVLASTARTEIPWRQRAFAAGLAPRGIVAASTASVFGLELVQQGAPGAGVDVRVWSPRAEEMTAARAEGLAVQSDPLLDDAAEEPLAEEIGTVLVVTDDDALNDALVVRLAAALGTARVHALPAAAERPLTLSRAGELGEPLFAADATAAELARRFDAGARVASLPAQHENGPTPAGVLPLLAVQERRRGGALDVHVVTPQRPAPRMRPGDVLLVLLHP